MTDNFNFDFRYFSSFSEAGTQLFKQLLERSSSIWRDIENSIKATLLCKAALEKIDQLSVKQYAG